ncbi:MAG: heme-dependent peroxidase [Gemmatimonadales bacterium]|nr:MAG: heme-dependent peroxidase [Gemmatimonadales bacterium]
MKESPLAPLVLDGWFVLHQFVRIVPGAETDENASSRLRALADLVARHESPDEEGWTGVYRIVGGGTDYMIMHFRPSLEALGRAEREFARHPGWQELIPTGDYLSVVELGLYHVSAALVEEAGAQGIEPHSAEWTALVEARMQVELEKRYVQSRLKPEQPEEMPYVCFYPMDKRRAVGQNWYELPLEERARMMGEHGSVGRRYAGRISQIISGSVGFDDWEWAVTLFATDPLDFKSLITEMRYDRASSVYAEFGPFWTGYRIPAAELAAEWAG